MKGLLIKDLYTVANYKKQYALLLVIMGGWSIFTKSFSFLATYSILLGGMLVLSIMSMDEAVHFNRYALTMPISVKTLIKEKYMLTCIGIASGSLVALLVECIAVLTPWHEGMIEWVSMAAMSTFFLLAYTISLPFIFKYGVEKARYIYIVIMVGMGGAIFGIAYVIKDTPVMLLEWAPSALSVVILVGIMLAVDVAAVVISYRASLKVVEKKEW